MTKARSNATAPNAKGTLVVGNGTDASTTLAVASTAGYLLTVDSAEATGLKWAAPSSGALTKIKSVTYSGAANTGTDFHSQLSSTYSYYLVLVRISCSTNSAEFRFQYSYGSNNENANYYGGYGALSISADNALAGGVRGRPGTYAVINTLYNNNLNVNQIWLEGVFGSNALVSVNGFGKTGDTSTPCWFGYDAETTRAYDGFVLFPSAGTITGYVTLYGVQK